MSQVNHCLTFRVVRTLFGFAAVVVAGFRGVFVIARDGDAELFAQPAAEVDLAAALAAEGHCGSCGGIELLFADRAADGGHDRTALKVLLTLRVRNHLAERDEYYSWNKEKCVPKIVVLIIAAILILAAASSWKTTRASAQEKGAVAKSTAAPAAIEPAAPKKAPLGFFQILF